MTSYILHVFDHKIR